MFVPSDNVVAYFEELSDHLRNAFKEACNNLLNLLGRFRRNALRRAPLFSIRLWDMFQRRLDKLPRTTNCIVGWHRSFQATVTACHQTFWKFLKLLKKEDALNRAKTLQADGGHNAPPARRRYANTNQTLTQELIIFRIWHQCDT